ncbi:MAG: hypothetical protein KAV42_09045 [Candidatus Krumholzibacteria bacterium]|nr:hypothetical protein [Candidatus Krumholzibacteria bacterium]
MKTAATRTRMTLACLLTSIFMVTLLAGSADAVPAFARKYKMSCTTCHAPAPRLKAYGEDFAGNAFQLEEGQEPPRAFYDTGDDLLMLQRDIPIAIRFDAFAHHTHYSGKEGEGMTDLKTPYGVKLMSGGNISKSIGYYFYFYMSEKGEVAGIEDAYIHFNNLFGSELDIMVGQFQISDPLFKRELRLTFEDYQIYKLRIGDTPTNLAYDRGLMITYTAPCGTDLVFEVVNGNGKDAVDETGYFDAEQWKNVLLRATHGFGPVRLGGFAYSADSRAPVWNDYVHNKHMYWGIDGTIDFKDIFQVNVQYLERTDDNPYYDPLQANEKKTVGGFVEMVWAVNGADGRAFVTGLVNMIDSDIDKYDYMSGTLNFSYLLRRNVRFLVEATYEDERERYDFITGFVSAF